MEANAKRAADDPRAIAYLGEVDRGASAVSVPRTNRADLLQVSPLDGLTSLTRRPPGRPRAGPERYYPGRAPQLPAPGASRTRGSPARWWRWPGPPAGAGSPWWTPPTSRRASWARCWTPSCAAAAWCPVDHVLLKDDADGVPDKVRDLAATRPQVVLVSGEPGPVATALLAELARQLPRARVVASPALAVTAGEGSGATAVTARAARVRPARRRPPRPAAAARRRAARRRCTATTPWTRCWPRCARAGATAGR